MRAPVLPVLFIVGPTATGKSSLALSLAIRHQAHILSLDSRQIYRHMSIGTAQPSEEDLSRVPHHFTGELDPAGSWNAFDCFQQVRERIKSLRAEGVPVIAAGGSGLYYSAVVHGIADIPADQETRLRLENRLHAEGKDALFAELQQADPESAQRMDPTKTQRLIRALEVLTFTGKPISWWQRQDPPSPFPFPYKSIGLHLPKPELEASIRKRVESMIRSGLEEEVRHLRSLGFDWTSNCLRTVGYSEWREYFEGKTSQSSVGEQIVIQTRRYAKRQMTWFRRETNIHWLQASDSNLFSLAEKYWTE